MNYPAASFGELNPTVIQMTTKQLPSKTLWSKSPLPQGGFFIKSSLGEMDRVRGIGK